MTNHLRIGTGAGFSADRLDPACELIKKGSLDYIVFECVGERTLAFGHRDRLRDPETGYNPWLVRRMEAILPLCAATGTRVITNMGVANPRAAARQTINVARSMGLDALRVAWINGDDVATLIDDDTPLPEIGATVGTIDLPVVGANAYIGVDALLPALLEKVDVVITGRCADPSLFLAPMVGAFNWPLDDWQRLGAGTMIGHLMECAAQVTGGYFADPGVKPVPNLAYVGFPIAEVASDGSAVITKLPDAGGCVTEQTVKEQLFYEIHDPSMYITPDVMADFSKARLSEIEKDRIQVMGGRGQVRPEQLKVTVAFDGGFLAEAEISYAGPCSQARATLAGEIVQERMANLHQIGYDLRIDLIGVNALHGTAIEQTTDTQDVRLRLAMRTPNQSAAEMLLWEVESLLCCGPAGGGGYRGHITPSVITYNAFLPRHLIETHVEVLTL